MILVYIDESGDTGHNLADKQQPVFVLGAMAVHQSEWKELERRFNQIISQFFNKDAIDDFELHTMDLVVRRGAFKSFHLEQTKEFRDRCLELVQAMKLSVVYRAIEKRRFQKFCEITYGKGISVAPYIMALPFVCTRINEIINAKNDLGILIFDQHQNLTEIEKSLKTLRLDTTTALQADNLIEQGFFVDSSKSKALQLTDLVLYYIRKFEEHKLGFKVSEHHQETFSSIEKVSVSLQMHERGRDILQWVGTNVVGKKNSDRPRRKEPSDDDPLATA